MTTARTARHSVLKRRRYDASLDKKNNGSNGEDINGSGGSNKGEYFNKYAAGFRERQRGKSTSSQTTKKGLLSQQRTS